MRTQYYLVVILVLSILVTGCGATPATPEPEADIVPINASAEQTITIGIVSDDPAEKIALFQLTAEYLAKHLTNNGILASKVVVTASQEEMNAKLAAGDVDIFFESPYGAIQAYEQAGAVPILRRWKKGVSEYYSVIVVSASSSIDSIEELQGKIIAFEDIGSTSGYFLPKSFLEENQYQLSAKTDESSSVSADEIGYIFTGSPENSLALLVVNKIDAMALQAGDFEDLSEEQREELRIIGQTAAVPRHIVLVSPQMPDALRDAVRDILINMENSEEGLEVLLLTEKTVRFDPLPEGTIQSLEVLFSE